MENIRKRNKKPRNRNGFRVVLFRTKGLHKYKKLVTNINKTGEFHDFQKRYEFLLSQTLAPQGFQIGGVPNNPEPVRELKPPDRERNLPKILLFRIILNRFGN